MCILSSVDHDHEMLLSLTGRQLRVMPGSGAGKAEPGGTRAAGTVAAWMLSNAFFFKFEYY